MQPWCSLMFPLRDRNAIVFRAKTAGYCKKLLKRQTRPNLHQITDKKRQFADSPYRNECAESCSSAPCAQLRRATRTVLHQAGGARQREPSTHKKAMATTTAARASPQRA